MGKNNLSNWEKVKQEKLEKIKKNCISQMAYKHLKKTTNIKKKHQGLHKSS